MIAWFELSIRRQTNFSDWKCNLSKRNSPTIFFNAPSELEHSAPRAGRRENSIVQPRLPCHAKRRKCDEYHQTMSRHGIWNAIATETMW
jgi:hypothetical protein